MIFQAQKGNFMEKFNARSIIERMKEALGKENDKALIEELGVAQTTFSNWKSRNNLPVDVILTFAQTHNLSLDWLISGKDAPTLDEMETELLNRFAQLSFSEKLDVFNRLQGVSAGSQHISHSTVGNVAGRDIHIGKK